MSAASEFFAKELVELSPAIIVGYATPSVVAVQQETHSIPIVFLSVTDPGLVASLAHADLDGAPVPIVPLGSR